MNERIDAPFSPRAITRQICRGEKERERVRETRPQAHRIESMLFGLGGKSTLPPPPWNTSRTESSKNFIVPGARAEDRQRARGPRVFFESFRSRGYVHCDFGRSTDKTLITSEYWRFLPTNLISGIIVTGETVKGLQSEAHTSRCDR